MWGGVVFGMWLGESMRGKGGGERVDILIGEVEMGSFLIFNGVKKNDRCEMRK